jgi:hypothetical protein
MNTKTIPARIFMALAALVLTPVGAWTLRAAFGESQPHLFVMLVFSGSLTLLLGLTGLVGFAASFASDRGAPDKTSDQ